MKDPYFTKARKIILIILAGSLSTGIVQFLQRILLGITYIGTELITDEIFIPIILIGSISCGVFSGIWIKEDKLGKIVYGILTFVLSLIPVTVSSLFLYGPIL